MEGGKGVRGRLGAGYRQTHCTHTWNSQRFTHNIVLKYSLPSFSEIKHAYKLIFLSVSLGNIFKRA